MKTSIFKNFYRFFKAFPKKVWKFSLKFLSYILTSLKPNRPQNTYIEFLKDKDQAEKKQAQNLKDLVVKATQNLQAHEITKKFEIANSEPLQKRRCLHTKRKTLCLCIRYLANYDLRKAPKGWTLVKTRTLDSTRVTFCCSWISPKALGIDT